MNGVSKIKEELLCLHRGGMVDLDRKRTGADGRGEPYYAHIALPLLDAVFSGGQSRILTGKAVSNYCEYYGLREKNLLEGYPGKDEQESLSEFVRKFVYEGEFFFRREVFKVSEPACFMDCGRSRAVAVLDLAELLRESGVEYLQDVAGLQDCADFRSAALNLPGITEYILDCFIKLSCCDADLKPSLRVVSFIDQLSGTLLDIEEAPQLLESICSELNGAFPHLTPGLLNYAILDYVEQGRDNVPN